MPDPKDIPPIEMIGMIVDGMADGIAVGHIDASHIVASKLSKAETDLQYFLNEQSELQRKMPSPHPTDLFLLSQEGPEDSYHDYQPTDEDRLPAIDFIHWNVTAAVDELHELLGEIGWKPWAKSRHINLEAAQGEWIDALHFMLNLALVLGLDAEEIKQKYDAKHAKNAKRQEEGYDGVSTKCPSCKRALDDEAVLCHLVPKFGDELYWCAMNRYYVNSQGRFVMGEGGLSE